MARVNLSGLYLQGEGVAKDYQKFFELNQQANQRTGNYQAQYNLGQAYYFGYGVPQDMGQAKMWFEKAAAQDFLPAKKMLQNMGLIF